jgi:hypothetical protein
VRYKPASRAGRINFGTDLAFELLKADLSGLT